MSLALSATYGADRSPKASTAQRADSPAISPFALRCSVLGCPRIADIGAVLFIGGEPVRAGFCLPHAAEYRVDEASA